MALVVSFSALGQAEASSIAGVIAGMQGMLTDAVIEKVYFTIDEITDLDGVDLVVYLGESSRFETTLGENRSRVPVVFVKSTMDHLMKREASDAPRYRMCMGVADIVTALARIAPLKACVDPADLDWGPAAGHITGMDAAERFFVSESIAAFRETYESLGGRWAREVPENGEFLVFLPMHDPAASALAEIAIEKWPGCTVLAGDGMTQMTMAEGEPWPANVMRVRHWSAGFDSPCNRRLMELAEAEGIAQCIDFDSCGMLFGAVMAAEQAYVQNGRDLARTPFDGPLGEACFGSGGEIEPGRLVAMKGEELSVVEATAGVEREEAFLFRNFQ